MLKKGPSQAESKIVKFSFTVYYSLACNHYESQRPKTKLRANLPLCSAQESAAVHGWHISTSGRELYSVDWFKHTFTDIIVKAQADCACTW